MKTATKSKSVSRAAPKKKTANSSNGKSNGAASDSMLMDLFKEELKDIYWAEKHLVKALPKMAKAATSDELAEAFNEHLEITKAQIERLEEVFGLIDKKPQAKKCEGMEGLVKEGESVIEDTEAGTSTRDAGLIISAQKVEHYEIAAYGGLVQLAKTLGLTDAAEILETTLSEEKEADELLTEIAVNAVNDEALEEEE